MDSMLISMEEYTVNANTVKNSVLERLQIDGVITEQQAEDYSEKWQIIIIKTNWFTSWLNKFKKEKDSYQCKYVKFEE